MSFKYSRYRFTATICKDNEIIEQNFKPNSLKKYNENQQIYNYYIKVYSLYIYV